MPSTLSAPLLAVLNSDARSDANWLQAVHNACNDCIGQIDRLHQTLDLRDRDVKVCLDAIRHSLQWASEEVCSVDEARVTLTRVLTIMESIAETV